MLISEFARVTRLTRDTVRFYARLGLLQPQTNGKGGRHPLMLKMMISYVRAKIHWLKGNQQAPEPDFENYARLNLRSG